MPYAPALLLIPTLLLTISFSAVAQTETRSTTIYRCGPDGRDLRESPCPAGTPGKATPVNFDQPGSADVRAAQDQAADASAQADQLERQRQRREAREQRQASKATAINGLSSSPKIKPAEGPKVTQLKPPKTEPPHKPSKAASSAR